MTSRLLGKRNRISRDSRFWSIDPNIERCSGNWKDGKTFPAWRQRGVHCSQTTVTKHERWKRGSQSDVRPRKRLCKNPNDMISISDLEDSTELMKNHWISDSSERSTRNPCQANSTNVKKKKGGKSKPVPKKMKQTCSERNETRSQLQTNRESPGTDREAIGENQRLIFEAFRIDNINTAREELQWVTLIKLNDNNYEPFNN